MNALRRRAAVAPFLVSVNPTYGAGLGRRPPQEPKHRTPEAKTPATSGAGRDAPAADRDVPGIFWTRQSVLRTRRT